jgi:hypothetical protein
MGDTAIEALHAGGPSNGPPTLLISKLLVSGSTIPPDDCAVVLLRPKCKSLYFTIGELTQRQLLTE